MESTAGHTSATAHRLDYSIDLTLFGTKGRRHVDVVAPIASRPARGASPLAQEASRPARPPCRAHTRRTGRARVGHPRPAVQRLAAIAPAPTGHRRPRA